MQLRPELLTHPNIPKPLHGLNPRTVLGTKWWNAARQNAYATHGYRCWACGVHKSQATFHQWLEGHEIYDIDYLKGRAEMIEVAALCHACHNFIHSGRLINLWRNSEISTDRVRAILMHGFGILRQAQLKAFHQAYETWAEVTGSHPDPHQYAVDKQAIFPPATDVAWEDWRLIISGQEFKPIHANYEAWLKYYQPGALSAD